MAYAAISAVRGFQVLAPKYTFPLTHAGCIYTHTHMHTHAHTHAHIRTCTHAHTAPSLSLFKPIQI